MTKPTALIILDGFGYRTDHAHNAIAHAHMPHWNQWWAMFPHAVLRASGTAVGLPEGYIGNSEVGHGTLGAGRVIQQPVTVFNEWIAQGRLCSNPTLRSTFDRVAQHGGRIHLMGLLSEAGVHSHINHLLALLDCLAREKVPVYLHLFLDGRDMPPRSADRLLRIVEQKLQKDSMGTIASLHGRFYAMDRDKNWERTQRSYDVLIGAPQANLPQETPSSLLARSYAQGVTDEFVVPALLDPEGCIRSGDEVIFFNFRPDRAVQLAQAFVDPELHEIKGARPEVSRFITMTPFNRGDEDAWNAGVTPLYSPELPIDTLKSILAARGKTMMSVAETEKYAHVTYFFSGGTQEPYAGETQVLVPSIPAKTYVQHPCMSAVDITDVVLNSLRTNPCDFYLINYANADMVGHSGDFHATVKAVECLDEQLGRLYRQIVERMDGVMFITADHGNAEQMFDEQTGQQHTAHTKNPVPFIMLDKSIAGKPKELPLTELADVGPFVLEHMAD